MPKNPRDAYRVETRARGKRKIEYFRTKSKAMKGFCNAKNPLSRWSGTLTIPSFGSIVQNG